MHTPPGQGLVQQEAMADLYERYWFIVLRTIHQHISSHEDAEDVLLDVFLAALESGRWRAMSSSISWNSSRLPGCDERRITKRWTTIAVVPGSLCFRSRMMMRHCSQMKNAHLKTLF